MSPLKDYMVYVKVFGVQYKAGIIWKEGNDWCGEEACDGYSWSGGTKKQMAGMIREEFTMRVNEKIKRYKEFEQQLSNLKRFKK